MAEPQRRQDDEPKQNPELDAILPDKDRVGDFLQEFDAYQKKLDEEWEQAKSSYQNKINHIMDEYIHQQKVNEATQAETPPAQNDKVSAAKPNQPEQGFQQRMEGLLARVESELRKTDRAHQTSIFDEFRPTIINVGHRSFKTFVRRCLLSLGILAVLGGLVFQFVVFFMTLAPQTPLPYSHATGGVMQNGKIYMADWFRKALYVHQLKRNLPIVAIENIPNNFITGLAITDKNVWTLDAFENKICRHALTEDHQVIEKYPTPGTKPVGLYWDGMDLWSADNTTHLLYRHHITDIESPTEQFEFPQMTVAGFVIHHNRVLALDGETRELTLFRLQNPLKALEVVDLDQYLLGSKPTGLVLTKTAVLVITNRPAQVVHIPLSRIKQSRDLK